MEARKSALVIKLFAGQKMKLKITPRLIARDTRRRCGKEIAAHRIFQIQLIEN